MKPLKHEIPSFLVRWCSPDIRCGMPFLYCSWCWDVSAFLNLIWIVVLVFWYRLLEFWAVISGGVFLEVFSICYKRTCTFLVAGIYLIKYDRGFVILLVNLLVKPHVFRFSYCPNDSERIVCVMEKRVYCKILTESFKYNSNKFHALYC